MRTWLSLMGLAGAGGTALPAAAAPGLTTQEDEGEGSWSPGRLRLLTDLDEEVALEADRESRLSVPRLRLTANLEEEVMQETARLAPLNGAWLDRLQLAAEAESTADAEAPGDAGAPRLSGGHLIESVPSAPTWDITAALTGTSEYRYRGISQTSRNPAMQGVIEVNHASGFYAGAWGSSISLYAGSRMELDLYAGWRGSFGGFGLDLGVTGFVFPGGANTSFVELAGRIGYTLGPVELGIGAAWAPDQSNIGGDDNLYLFSEASLGVPGTPITIKASLGREDGAFGGIAGAKWDWSLGTEIVLDRFTLGLTWVDTNQHRLLDLDRSAQSRLVAAFTVEF
jgi:uncharacterized protein (TIGR02001 family)